MWNVVCERPIELADATGEFIRSALRLAHPSSNNLDFFLGVLQSVLRFSQGLLFFDAVGPAATDRTHLARREPSAGFGDLVVTVANLLPPIRGAFLFQPTQCAVDFLTHRCQSRCCVLPEYLQGGFEVAERFDRHIGGRVHVWKSLCSRDKRMSPSPAVDHAARRSGRAEWLDQLTLLYVFLDPLGFA